MRKFSSPLDVTCEIREWYIVGRMIRGRLHGHPQIADGTFSSSDYVKEFLYGGEWIIAVGFSGRRYRVFLNQHHASKQDVAL